MRRMILAALAVVALAAFTACGNDDGEVTISTPEGDVQIDTDGDGEGSVEFEGEDGDGSGSFEFGTGELPDDFPDDIPLPDDFEVAFSGSGTDVGQGDFGAAVSGTTSESASDLIDFYESGLEDAGYDVQGTTSSEFEGAAGGSVAFSGNGIEGAVIIGGGIPVPGGDGDGDGGTSLTIGYGSSE